MGSAYRYLEYVLKGMQYLNVVYPEWLGKVDESKLDLYDHRQHVLAQATGLLIYETREILYWTREELFLHGFVPEEGHTFFTPLTEEWCYQIRELKKDLKCKD